MALYRTGKKAAAAGGFPAPGYAYVFENTTDAMTVDFSIKALPSFTLRANQSGEGGVGGLINVDGYSSISLTGSSTQIFVTEYDANGNIIRTSHNMPSHSVTFDANTKYIMFTSLFYYAASVAFTLSVTLS